MLADAAMQVAQAERARSVADGVKAREAWQEQGGNVVTWSPDAREHFGEAAAAVYNRFIPEFGEGMIERIRSLG